MVDNSKKLCYNRLAKWILKASARCDKYDVSVRDLFGTTGICVFGALIPVSILYYHTYFLEGKMRQHYRDYTYYDEMPTSIFFKKLPRDPAEANGMLFAEGSKHFRRSKRDLGWAIFFTLLSVALILIYALCCTGEAPVLPVENGVAAIMLFAAGGLGFLSLLCVIDTLWRLTFACQMLNLRAYLRYY